MSEDFPVGKTILWYIAGAFVLASFPFIGGVALICGLAFLLYAFLR